MRVMRRPGFQLAVAGMLSAVLWAADWPMPGGNPQRNGWAASERKISKANVSSLKLLYRFQTDNQSRGNAGLTSPIISGNLITYRGFKEMLMFAGSSDKVFSVDADLNRLIWESNLSPSSAGSNAQAARGTNACAGGLSSPVVMAGSSSNSLHFASLASRSPAEGAKHTRSNPYFPPLSQSIYPLLPTTLTKLNAVYTVSSDGYLHVLNSSTGEDLLPPVPFVPARTKVTSLNLRDNVVYATTAGHCDGYQDGLFAIDLLSPQKTVSSFLLRQGGFAGWAGTTMGNDGTLYVQVDYPKENSKGHLYETVVALTPRELKVKDTCILGDKPVKTKKDQPVGITPAVFSLAGRDVVIAGGRNGKIYLLDSKSLGGADHRTPLYSTDLLIPHGKKLKADAGVFSTWLDVDSGSRFFYALTSNAGDKTGGTLLSFALRGTPGQPTLEPIWTAKPTGSPVSTVIAAGMVFILSEAQTKSAAGSILQIQDATTGKDLYRSAAVPTAIPPGAELALANGRVYFTGSDNAVYCFGVPSQHSQLTEP